MKEVELSRVFKRHSLSLLLSPYPWDDLAFRQAETASACPGKKINSNSMRNKSCQNMAATVPKLDETPQGTLPGQLQAVSGVIRPRMIWL